MYKKSRKLDTKSNTQLSDIQKMIILASKLNNVNVSEKPNNNNKVIYIREGEKIYSINSSGVKRRSYKMEKENIK